MKFGNLDFKKVKDHPDLVGDPVNITIQECGLADIYVSAIDPELADTAAFCEHYGIGMNVSANCVVVEAKRADKVWYAACMIRATDRVDVNSIVRKYLEARKISFAPMDRAVSLTAMEYGGITPIGLPEDWPILIDSAVASTKQVIIGSGIRKSKLLVPGSLLGGLSNSLVMDIAKID